MVPGGYINGFFRLPCQGIVLLALSTVPSSVEEENPGRVGNFGLIFPKPFLPLWPPPLVNKGEFALEHLGFSGNFPLPS